MRKRLLAVLLSAAVLPAMVHAQGASREEVRAVEEIGECLLEGLPQDWRIAHVIVELAEPGADTGRVQYLVGREDAPDNELEPFTPCDTRQPARRLLEVRKEQPADRRGWTTARLVINAYGEFSLTYDYPK
jgi:hypothetical protein